MSSKPPYRLQADFRAKLLSLAAEAEAEIGVADAQLAIVIHQCRGEGSECRYWLSIACDAHPKIVRSMRRMFPMRGTGDFAARIGTLGDLELDCVTIADLDRALTSGRCVASPSEAVKSSPRS